MVAEREIVLPRVIPQVRAAAPGVALALTGFEAKLSGQRAAHLYEREWPESDYLRGQQPARLSRGLALAPLAAVAEVLAPGGVQVWAGDDTSAHLLWRALYTLRDRAPLTLMVRAERGVAGLPLRAELGPEAVIAPLVEALGVLGLPVPEASALGPDLLVDGDGALTAGEGCEPCGQGSTLTPEALEALLRARGPGRPLRLAAHPTLQLSALAPGIAALMDGRSDLPVVLQLHPEANNAALVRAPSPAQAALDLLGCGPYTELDAAELSTREGLGWSCVATFSALRPGPRGCGRFDEPDLAFGFRQGSFRLQERAPYDEGTRSTLAAQASDEVEEASAVPATVTRAEGGFIITPSEGRCPLVLKSDPQAGALRLTGDCLGYPYIPASELRDLVLQEETARFVESFFVGGGSPREAMSEEGRRLRLESDGRLRIADCAPATCWVESQARREPCAIERLECIGEDTVFFLIQEEPGLARVAVGEGVRCIGLDGHKGAEH